MRYMILIHSDEQAWAALPPAEMEREIGAYFAYTQALRDAGALVESHQLNAAATAKSIRVRPEGVQVVDGPYSDVKEQLGGFYLIEVDGEAQALHWAQQCPGARHGVVEVRPCITH